ncbi:MAG: hypothetical protein Q8Q56_04995, partial [Alphaproteobacteria bacterium]|nr:hypothetical protein [Alphaproteobacteria bacterium]
MKQKFINSISLLAVCAVLSGCGNDNPQKSVSELITEIKRDTQNLSALSTAALDQAKQEGIPLPSDVRKILEDDIAEGSAPSPSTAKEALAELEETVADLEVLENSNTNIKKFYEVWKAKQARTKVLRELLEGISKMADIDRDDDIALRAHSSILTAASASVLDLFSPPTSLAPEGSSELVRLGQQAPEPGQIRLLIPGVRGTPDAASTIRFRINAAAFSRGVGSIVGQWLAPVERPADESGAVVVSGRAPSLPSMPTHEAVRQIMASGLRASEIVGASFGRDADPALVASITNIGALTMLQRSESFRDLSPQQQHLALRATVAMAHTTSVSDSFRLEDRINSLVFAIAKLPSSGSTESRSAAVRSALQDRGVNPLLRTDTERVLSVVAQTSDRPPQEQGRILGTVLMLTNGSGARVSDADFNAVVTAAR